MAGYRWEFSGADETHQPFRHFFKLIMAGAVQSKKLMLPGRFVRTFRNELYDEVKLEVPTGRVWTVGLTRERGEHGEPQVWLDFGFGHFLDYYSITEQGYLLMFEYNGFSSFKVIICDKSACEIVYPRPLPLPSSSDEEDDDEDEEEEESIDLGFGTKETDEDSDSDTNEEVPHMLSRRENGRRRTASGSRRKPPTERSAGTSSAAAGERNRGKRPILTEEDSDGATEDSQSADDWEIGRSKRKGKQAARSSNGASGSRHHQPTQSSAATRYLETASGRDKVLWSRLLASKIMFSAKFQLTFAKLSRVSKKGIEKAISCNKQGNPSVLMVMQKFNIHPGIMYLPTKFAKEYLRRDSETIVLRAFEGGEFVGEFEICTTRNNKQVLLFLCWGEFCQANYLVQGDVCLLELVDTKDKVFHVHIFRA
ncbi:unnamed protein product [Linum trigynum]|uniref:TF-B3 domain-containing protein n=1 Tax=Linum trigynum TaxID=586398 RepID=A0AAV2CB92_9ROSI